MGYYGTAPEGTTVIKMGEEGAEYGGEYEIHIDDVEMIVYGCDCADSISDLKKLKELREAIDGLIKKLEN